MNIPPLISDTEVWLVGLPADLDTLIDAITRLGYVCYLSPPVPGRGFDRRHRAYLRLICRVPTSPAADPAG